MPTLLRDLRLIGRTTPGAPTCPTLDASCFQYLVVIVDRATRTVLAWRQSYTLDNDFCVEALQEALATYGAPAIFNAGRPANSPAMISRC